MKSTLAVFFRRLGRGLGLFAVVTLWPAQVPAAPAGDAKADTNAFAFVDLSPFSPAASPEVPGAQMLDGLPSGRQLFHGVPFLIRDRISVTGLESARNGEFFPPELSRIPIGRKARRLHLLHGTLGAEKDGVPMAKLVFHYASGAEESVRLGYGVHVRHWMKVRTEKKSGLADPNSQIAWATGDNGDRVPDYRLFQTAFENPRPDDVLSSLDVVSLFSRATPFIVGLSVEERASGLPANKPLPSRKVVREMNEFGEPVYRGEFVVRVTDGTGNAPLTNAVAMLSVTDDQQPFSFGEARADAGGICRLPYPPQQTLAFHLLVRAPNRVPQILSETRTNPAGFSREFTVALVRGVTVGGVVKAADGSAIPGAKVALYRITKTGAREYTRTDYDLAITDAGGKWTSSSLPPGFEGFSFEVSHPEFRTALYAMPGQATAPPGAATRLVEPRVRGIVQAPDAADGVQLGFQQPAEDARIRRPVARPAGPARLLTVTSNSLLAATAEMTLQPAILVSGVVLDSDGKPVAHAPVLFQRHNSSYERKYLQTDAGGGFRVMAPEPGDGALIVVRSGQTPRYQQLSILPGMAPMEVKLAPARTLRGRVIDRQQRPVPGATVRLDEWMGASDLLRFQALTDEEGRFTWNGAPTDQVLLYVTKSNYYTMRHSMSGQNNDLTLYLNRPPGVSGKVYDAETKEPIDLFTIIKGRKYSTSDQMIRWERGDSARGRNGEYSVRIDEYYFQPEARIMVEAPGYIPQISRAFPRSDSYTSDFALKKGRGIRGLVTTAEGAPAANATVVLVDRNDTGYMDMAGQFRAGSGGDFARSDARGQFEFSPKLDSDWILASHERGFAEMKADQVESVGKIVLQPWGRVTGIMQVGDKPEPDQGVRLQNRYDRYYEPGHRSTALSLYLRAEPDDAGQFVFEKVPPGERRLFVEYRFKERQYGETPLSHGLPLSVKPGETLEVVLGGSGRKVVGRVKVIGGDQSDVDWRRDVHRLTLVLPADGLPQPPDVSKLVPADQQKAWEQYNQRQREFWQSDAGRLRERAERSYVLVFETNGQFRVDHVPPGKYLLSIIANDPDEEYYRQRMIGSLNHEIRVPAVAQAKVNEPFDVGTLELTIRGKLRIGKPVPPLETKSLDGTPIQLADYRGKHVLLFFWSSDAGTGSYDLQVLKEMHNTYAAQDKLVVLGLSLDANAQAAAQFVKNNGILWPQAHLGEWSQTQVPAAFGVDGIPTGVLIDGEGRLAARNLRGSSIRTAIRNALASPSASAVGR